MRKLVKACRGFKQGCFYQYFTTSLNTRKLDEETENLTHEKVPTELKKAIIQGRTEKKLTQAQLAQHINEKPQIIQEYESGKAIPNQQFLINMKKV
ncbi:putative transcription factor Lambda-DB family [Helianthus annuus]|nr:putative transcription factor Lambda-DB family [Helianthus annuus]